ncbi:hypothetical protein AAT19DRAFT_13421 [Rhodotorula toruloides]|uniref:Uncharacterized protein n=1 Tax=Rhodotorula toruloides TaxID=5286 RepID=A0A2T0AEG3_RHOTO|nr:hypothetical protein AAT19DRAFT_13421 [Rhodotorula toruloides]
MTDPARPAIPRTLQAPQSKTRSSHGPELVRPFTSTPSPSAPSLKHPNSNPVLLLLPKLRRRRRDQHTGAHDQQRLSAIALSSVRSRSRLSLPSPATMPLRLLNGHNCSAPQRTSAPLRLLSFIRRLHLSYTPSRTIHRRLARRKVLLSTRPSSTTASEVADLHRSAVLLLARTSNDQALPSRWLFTPLPDTICRKRLSTSSPCTSRSQSPPSVASSRRMASRRISSARAAEYTSARRTLTRRRAGIASSLPSRRTRETKGTRREYVSSAGRSARAGSASRWRTSTRMPGGLTSTSRRPSRDGIDWTSRGRRKRSEGKVLACGGACCELRRRRLEKTETRSRGEGVPGRPCFRRSKRTTLRRKIPPSRLVRSAAALSSSLLPPHDHTSPSSSTSLARLPKRPVSRSSRCAACRPPWRRPPRLPSTTTTRSARA